MVVVILILHKLFVAFELDVGILQVIVTHLELLLLRNLVVIPARRLTQRILLQTSGTSYEFLQIRSWFAHRHRFHILSKPIPPISLRHPYIRMTNRCILRCHNYTTLLKVLFINNLVKKWRLLEFLSRTSKLLYIVLSRTRIWSLVLLAKLLLRLHRGSLVRKGLLTTLVHL